MERFHSPAVRMKEPRPPAPDEGKEELQRLREVQLRQLQFRRRSLGEDHVGTIESMEGLSQTLVALGEYDSARSLQERSLSVRNELGGGRDPATAATAWNLFDTLDRLSDRVAMRGVFEDHLAWLLDVSPDDLKDESLLRIRERVHRLPAGKRFGYGVE
jgi:hypothetical protein